jgi:hypothetical protein
MSQKSILVVLWFTLLTACWSSQPAAPPTATVAPPTPGRSVTVIDVVIHDSYYGDHNTNTTSPPVWEVPTGSDVILNVTNLGQLQHNWAIVKKGVVPPIPYEGGQGSDIIFYGAGMVYHDNRTTVTFVAPSEPGEYLVICTVANHYPLMQGRLLVN